MLTKLIVIMVLFVSLLLRANMVNADICDTSYPSDVCGNQASSWFMAMQSLGLLRGSNWKNQKLYRWYLNNVMQPMNNTSLKFAESNSSCTKICCELLEEYPSIEMFHQQPPTQPMTILWIQTVNPACGFNSPDTPYRG